MQKRNNNSTDEELQTKFNNVLNGEKLPELGQLLLSPRQAEYVRLTCIEKLKKVGVQPSETLKQSFLTFDAE